MNSNTATVDCPKCFGVKSFACFAHVVGGTCFRCGGLGTVEFDRARIEASRSGAAKNLERAYAGKYTVIRDGVDCVALLFSSFKEANAERKARSDDGCGAWMVAKWSDGAFRYRDGTQVKFCH